MIKERQHLMGIGAVKENMDVAPLSPYKECIYLEKTNKD